MTVRQDTLSNGFRVVSERMEGLKSASIGVWVMSGGRHERAEQNGIAHFLEHMAFKGTERRNALQIAEAIEDVGGYINAYTSREMTAYYARVLGADVALAVDVIADILRRPLFEDSEIEIERGVILQEIGQALDTPDDIVFDWLQEVAYPDQPLGRSILGEAERVSSFNRADLSTFVSERYGPGEMILAAAGDVDHDALMEIAQAQFGDMAPVFGEKAEEPATFGGGERRQLKALEQVHFAMAFEGPNYCDTEIYTAQIFATAFGGGMSSRLFQELRERRGLCYSIFAQAGAYRDTGLLTIYAGTSAGQIEELALLAMDELRRSASDLTAEEVERARAQMKAGLLMGLESPSNRAERLARMVSIWGRVPTLEETVERIEAVDLAGVRAHAGHMAQDAGSALALYGPAEAAPSLGALRERLAS